MHMVMKRLQAFKFELGPNGAQQRDMRRFAGSCRFVFNKALALQQSNHESGEKFIGYLAMAKQLTEWRNGPQTPWLTPAQIGAVWHAYPGYGAAVGTSAYLCRAAGTATCP